MLSRTSALAYSFNLWQSLGSVEVWNIVVHGKDVLEVVLVREDVNHPGKDLGQKGSSLGIARFLGVDRTEHAEFRIFAEIFLDLVCRGSAKIRVLVPAGNAQRNAFIEFILGGIGVGSKHHAFQSELLGRGLKVQQRSGSSRIEFGIRQFRVGVVVEMKLGLIDGRICLNEPVGQSFFVILVFLDVRSDLRYYTF